MPIFLFRRLILTFSSVIFG
jgi:hypothetical protein